MFLDQECDSIYGFSKIMNVMDHEGVSAKNTNPNL
jgi:hypothetical protein